MKTLLAVIVAGVCCLTAKAEDWTVDGKVYHNVTVTKIDGDTVHITYDGGIGSVNMSDLSKDVQKELGYNPIKVSSVTNTDQAPVPVAPTSTNSSSGLQSAMPEDQEYEEFFQQGPYPGAKYEYDEIRDSFSLDSPEVTIGPSTTFRFLVGGSGAKPAKPADVIVLINSHSDDWRFKDDGNAIFLADGKRIPVKLFSRDTKVLDDGVAEYITYDVPLEIAEEIANSKSVKIGIGVYDFEIEDSDLKHLGMYMSAISRLSSNSPTAGKSAQK